MSDLLLLVKIFVFSFHPIYAQNSGRGTGMLLLTNDDVERVLTMADCIAVLRRFFAEEANGRVLTRQRTESWLPHNQTDTFYQCKTMEGGISYAGRYAIRIDSNITKESRRGNVSRTEHLPLANGNWMGMLLIFSTETGELLGWMPDGYLQRTRVGALYALAADYLARADSAEVGLIGSGWQAGGQVLGLRCIREIGNVRVYSPSGENRTRFAGLEKTLGVRIQAIDGPREAICGTDIIALATNANQKVIEASWVEPGQHINSVRFLELDPLLYQTCDRVVVNRTEPWIRNHHLGELCPRDVTDAKLPAAPSGAFEARDFFASQLKRGGPREITLFPNEASNYQLGGQFAAVAAFVLDKACEQGLGRELPSDWFSQLLPP
jgi:ornithine cyclodeaminase/alanine dehydrogenase-like protein (mu-crystallin family)